MVIFASGCAGGTSTPAHSPAPAPPRASFPAKPPASAKCSGKVLDHRDIKHPDLGEVRVFLVRRAVALDPKGCVAAVTGNGHALKTIDVDIYENELHFATPESDTTKNTFVIYNPGRYDGVLVLVPNKEGFEDIGWSSPEDHYRSAKLAYYSARLVGPGGDGRYTIVKSGNSCVPSCAEGSTTNVTLHWNGHEYLPAA
ncbi:hypothetical protein ACFCYB_42600 [Streptomyces sp. NPDC056309]|uniref:hypothetical protein n=1 Tax=unclassified Streptomyces TaxID=2593676 RepID=UPI0035DB041E